MVETSDGAGPVPRRPVDGGDFHGWRTVIVGAFALTCAGAFFQPLVLGFSASAGAEDGQSAVLVAAYAVAFALELTFFVVMGRYVDRRGARGVLVCCFVVMSMVCLLALGRSVTLIRSLVFVGVSLGSSLGSRVVVATAVNKRVRRRRATAMALLVMPHLALGYVIAATADVDAVWSAVTSRLGIIILAVVMAASALPVARLLRDVPEGVEHSADGDELSLADHAGSERSPDGGVCPDYTGREIFGGRRFWQICVGVICGVLVPEVGTRFWLDWFSGDAGLMLNFIEVAKLFAFFLALLVAGIVADRTSSVRWVMVVCIAMGVFGLAVYLWSRSTWALLVLGVLGGIGEGGLVGLELVVVGVYFGRRSYGMSLGILLALVSGMDVLASPLLIGLFSEVFSLLWSSLILMAAGVLGCAAIVALGVPRLSAGQLRRGEGRSL